MKISNILVQEAVILDLESKDKDGALVEMANILAATEPSLDSGKLVNVLRERESLQSTGMGEGVAIPHGRIANLNQLMVAFARSRKGVDFDSIDGQPTHLFFVLVVPESSGGQHLKALARISRFLRDETFRESLLEAETREEIVQAIQTEDARF
jgi:PTS system nitrogen regulatory IIA component